MQLSIEELKDAVELLGDAGGEEAAIISQFVLDLAVSRFNNDGESLGKNDVRKLLQLRIARHRAAGYRTTNAIH
jgi:hypothetical protein